MFYSYGFPWFSHSNTIQTPSESPIFSAISWALARLADCVQGLGEGGEIPGGHRPFRKGAVSIGFWTLFGSYWLAIFQKKSEGTVLSL